MLFSINCGQIEDIILEGNISIYLIRFSLFSERVCVIPVFCGSLHCVRHASVSLEMKLFFKCWNSLDSIHRHFIFSTFSGNILIPNVLYCLPFVRENLHVQSRDIAAMNHMHWTIGQECWEAGTRQTDWTACLSFTITKTVLWLFLLSLLRVMITIHLLFPTHCIPTPMTGLGKSEMMA